MGSLGDVLLSTERILRERPERMPDYHAENEALGLIAAEMASRPDNVLGLLCEQVLDLCDAQSSGVSLATGKDGDGDFVWPAVAGAWAAYAGGGMPRDASPCGLVMQRNASLLFHEVETHFPALAHASPRIGEVLLAPFCVAGHPIGTVWAIVHSGPKRFDREDKRILESVARFASAAYQIHHEVTKRAEGERLRDVVLALGDELREMHDPGSVATLAAGCLADGLRADRAGFGTVAGDGETVDVIADWSAPGIENKEGRHSVGNSSFELEDLKLGRTVAVADVRSDERTKTKGEVFEALSVRSLLNLPIMERGRLASVVFASHRAVHHWTENELRFVRQVGDRVYAALARIRADQQQRIVNEELSHRLKNTLAMVQAVATQTLGHVTERDAVSALTQRIGALARAHDVLLHQNWTQSRMGDVTQAVLSTFDSGNRFRMTGPNVMLGARATLSYSLLLHEMGTNALKYGALSVPEGHVEIEWRISGHASEAVLDLTWQEFGGPAPTENTERGFGSRLIRMGLIGAGGVEIKYPATGLSARMEALLSQMQQ